jgi:hypothetical protein
MATTPLSSPAASDFFNSLLGPEPLDVFRGRAAGEKTIYLYRLYRPNALRNATDRHRVEQ